LGVYSEDQLGCCVGKKNHNNNNKNKVEGEDIMNISHKSYRYH